MFFGLRRKVGGLFGGYGEVFIFLTSSYLVVNSSRGLFLKFGIFVGYFCKFVKLGGYF